jgi:hypothetical protein
MLGGKRMKRDDLGVGGTVSALLTVLLLVAGFAVSTGLLSAIYSAQSEVLRKAVNVGEAVSERLQAFVYEDVRTNRTLLTVRNVGSVGSEVEYLMAVGYDGSVLAEVRPGDTIRLGTQQAFTLFLSDLLGPGFDNYTEVRSRMATLYLKTVKGGVFGSGYMAPPSVMTAAYATSTTTISTTETSVTTLPIKTGRETITSWNATVILDNPDHWPVEAYVGAAFAHTFKLTEDRFKLQTTGFPNWGFQPGLEAKKDTPWGIVVANVTSADEIRIPRYVACRQWGVYYWLAGGGGWNMGGTGPVVKPSTLGPTYVELKHLSRHYDMSVCAAIEYDRWEAPDPNEAELFDPRGTTVRGAVFSFTPVATYTTPWSRTATLTWSWQNVYTRTTFTETRVDYWWTRIPGYGGGLYGTTTTWYPLATGGRFWGIDDSFNVRTQTRTLTLTYSTTYEQLGRGSATTWTVTVPVTRYYIRPGSYDVNYTVTKTFTVRASGRTTVYLYHTITTTVNDVFTAVFTAPGTTWRDDARDMQRITFPGGIYAEVRRCQDDRDPNRCPDWWYVRNIYKLAYIKVVDLWNTTNVLAFKTNASDFVVKVDRPIGIAAVYTYDRSEEKLPPPPRPPTWGENYCIDKTETCDSFDAGKVRITSDIWDSAPEGQCDGQVTVTFVKETNDPNCGAWVAPAPGAYTTNQLQPCPQSGNTVTCTAPAGSTIIRGCAR